MTEPIDPTDPSPAQPDPAQQDGAAITPPQVPVDAPADADTPPLGKTSANPVDEQVSEQTVEQAEAQAVEQTDASASVPTPADQAPPAQNLPKQPSWHENEMGWLRVIIVAWCLWLMGSWVMALVADTSVPRVRWMLFAGSFGLMLVWPAFRLSERTRERGVGVATLAILLEWFALIGVYQAVIWSLNLIALWPFVRGIWLDAAVVAWSLLTALIVAAARAWPGAAARMIGMLLCIALVFAEPVLIWASVVFAGGQGWSMRVSPVQAFWELTQPAARSPIAPWDARTLSIALVAVAGWGALGLWALGESLVRRRLAKRAQA